MSQVNAINGTDFRVKQEMTLENNTVNVAPPIISPLASLESTVKNFSNRNLYSKTANSTPTSSKRNVSELQKKLLKTKPPSSMINMKNDKEYENYE